MFHLAPTGLPSPSKIRVQRSQHKQIEKQISNAVKDIATTHSSMDHKIVFNMIHPNTITMVRSLDAFFSHGLLTMDKCYWLFVREFIPTMERVDLKVRWNCFDKRQLSLAWLKDSLNKRNLHFQMFGFIASGDGVKRAHYARDACIRNLILLKRVCMMLDDIAKLEFNIEPPFIFRTEETPIALPVSSPVDGTMSPVQSSNSSLTGNQFSPNIPLNIHRKRESIVRSSMVVGSGSFCELARNSYLDGLVNDLPEVNLSTLSIGNEPIVHSAREQNYILDEILRKQRDNMIRAQSSDDDEANCRGPSDSVVPEDPCSSTYISDEALEQLLVTNPRYGQMDEEEIPSAVLSRINVEEPSASSKSLANTAELLLDRDEKSVTASSTKDDDGLSELDQDEVPLEGEVFVDVGEQIRFQLELCVKDGEKFQRMFRLYTGHAAGQPVTRFLLLTNQFIYLLAAEPMKDGEMLKDEEIDAGMVDEVALEVDAFERTGQQRTAWPLHHDDLQQMPTKYRTLVVLSLSDLDHLTIGVDAQVLCFHSRRQKFRPSKHSSHEQRTFLVETGSRVLTKAIAFAVRRAFLHRMAAAQLASSSSSSAMAPDDGEQQNAQLNASLSIIASHSSQLGIVLKRFLRLELGIERPEILHLSLVYWQQIESHQQKGGLLDTCLENYLYVRELAQSRGWWRESTSEWQQNYVVLRGTMLYQFSDSSFKFAHRSLNLRDSVDLVNLVDLKEEKYSFQVSFTADTVGEGPHALQFSCPNAEVMRKWVEALSNALSISSEAPLPVACMTILTETHMVFAQEGMNCFVDGFMRSLSTFFVHDIAEVFAIRTEIHSALVIRREKGLLDDWLVFREQSELDRFVERLQEHWKLPVIIFASEGEEEGEIENENGQVQQQLMKSQLLMECARVPDMWHNVQL